MPYEVLSILCETSAVQYIFFTSIHSACTYLITESTQAVGLFVHSRVTFLYNICHNRALYTLFTSPVIRVREFYVLQFTAGMPRAPLPQYWLAKIRFEHTRRLRGRGGGGGVALKNEL